MLRFGCQRLLCLLALAVGFMGIAKAQPLGQDLNNTNKNSNSCAEAIKYVESPSGLLGDWDRTMSLYKINRNASSKLNEFKKDLLSDTWWAASSGPDIAREINFFADALEHAFAAFSPNGELIGAVSDAGQNVSALVRTIKETIDAGGDVVSVVKGGEKAVQEIQARELAKQNGLGRLYAIRSIFKDIQDRAETAEAGKQLKSEVQLQIRNLDSAIEHYNSSMAAARDKLNGYEDIRSALISNCALKPSDMQGIRIGGPLSRTAPVYPPDALKARIQGAVLLHAIIAADGHVAQLDAISGDPALINAALDAVKTWIYEPSTLGDQAVAIDTTITVNFTLSN